MDDIQARWTLWCMFFENWSEEFAVLWNPRTNKATHSGLSLNGTLYQFSPGRSFTYYFRKIQMNTLPNGVPLLPHALDLHHPYTHQLLQFSGGFKKLRKATISFVMSVCLSVCLSVRSSVWNNAAATEQIFTKFDIWVFFENTSRKFTFHWNMTRIKGTYMKTCAHLWCYLAEFFLSYEMFQIKFVEKIETHTLWSMTFFF